MKEICDQRGFLFLVQDWYSQLMKTLSRFLHFHFPNSGPKSALSTLVGTIRLLVFGLLGTVILILHTFTMFILYVLKLLLHMLMQLKQGVKRYLVSGLMMVCNTTKALVNHFLSFTASLVLICLVVISLTPMVVIALSRELWICSKECSQAGLKYLTTWGIGSQNSECTTEKTEKS